MEEYHSFSAASLRIAFYDSGFHGVRRGIHLGTAARNNSYTVSAGG